MPVSLRPALTEDQPFLFALHASTRAEEIATWGLAGPQALDVLVAQGFTPLANAVTRRTLARAVTLEQACRLQGKDLEEVLAELRRALEAGSK